MIRTLSDDRSAELIAFPEHVITVPLNSAVVVSVDTVDISGKDLEIFNIVECNNIGADIVLLPSIWNPLGRSIPEMLHSRR